MKGIRVPFGLLGATVGLLGLSVVAAPPHVHATGATTDDADSRPTRAAEAPLPDAERERLLGVAPGLESHVLELALRAVRNAEAEGHGGDVDVLTVIDYSIHSSEPRMWVFDLSTSSLMFHERVTHGSGSGSGRGHAESFSNVVGSRQTSLGLFRTGETYWGRNGYSLRLHGLDEGFNDRAFERAIVIHGADYAREEFVERTGRLGRSWGCPAVADHVAEELIDAIKGGSMVFSYYPDETWLEESSLL